MKPFPPTMKAICSKIRAPFQSREFREIFDMAVRSAFWTAIWFLCIVLVSDVLHAIGFERIIGFFTSHISVFFEKRGLSLESQRAVAIYLRDIPGRISMKVGRFFIGILTAFVSALVVYDAFRSPRFIGRLFVHMLRSTVATYVFMASLLFIGTTIRSGDRYFTFWFAFWVWLLWVALYSLLNHLPFSKFVSEKISLAMSVGRVFLQSRPELKASLLMSKRPSTKPLFLADCALGEDGKSAIERDELGLKDDAEQFAKSVLNNGSDTPMVFGIDSPWGSGKTSYLALCKELVWNPEPDIVVFHFNPTLYDLKRQDLFDVFSSELVATLRKEGVRTGSLKSKLKQLGNIFHGTTYSWKKFTFTFNGFPKETTKEIIDGLERDVRRSGKRIIAIIDDLDRLYLEDVKDMLGIVRNVFNISGVSFVLCYDSETVNSFEFEWKRVHRYSSETALNSEKLVPTESVYESHEPNNQAINAYFEKMVQVKKTLLPRRDRLEQYFKREIDKLFGKGSLHGGKFLVALADFFRDEELTSYGSYLFDIRKLKRIINYIELSELYRKDLDDYDFDAKILIKLIVLYVNFPDTFRRIYVFETMANEGNNSLSWAFLDEDAFYEKRRRVYGNESQKTGDSVGGILKSFLDISKRNGVSVGEDVLKVRKHENRLETVTGLRVIADGKFPPKHTQQRYSDKCLAELRRSHDVEGMFNAFRDTYSLNNGEGPRSSFFAAARRSESLDYITANLLIQYILNNLHKYSLVSGFSGTYEGIRKDLVYEMLILLDKKGWQDENGESYANTEDNVVQIAQKILEPSGLLSRILDRKRGVLGLYDVVDFYSGSQSAETLFSLKTGLAVYEENGERGAVGIMARRIWSDFRERYIETKRSIFADIEELSETELLGEFSAPIRKAFEGKEAESLEKWVYLIRMVVANKIIVLFASESQNEIGHYNSSVSGSGHTIFSEMRTYLFEICFTMDNEDENDETNAQRFVNYLLAGFERVLSYSRKSEKWKPSVKSRINTLGEKELRDYWKKNGKRIKEISRKWDPETRVHTYNYVAIYRDDLEPLFKELDKLLESKSEPVDPEIV